MKQSSKWGAVAQFTSFIACMCFCSSLGELYTFSSPTWCVFYDKPPRTGSTTIGNALTHCLEQKGYTSLDKPISSFGRDEVVIKMLSKPGRKKSAVVKHMRISNEDVIRLQHGCNHILYLTSCRAMKERIASKAKYSMTRRHGNFTISPELFSKVLKKALNDEATESYLESYPFTGNLTMEPDYIIRAESLKEDLDILLRALGCSSIYPSANVHTVHGVGSSDLNELQSVALQFGDTTFRRLSRLAKELNTAGAKKARAF